jgi:hypothetical protein
VPEVDSNGTASAICLAGSSCSGYQATVSFGTGASNALSNAINGSGGFVTYGNAAGAAAVLTGYTSGAGTVAATDTILAAIQKLNGNFAAAPWTSANTSGTAGGLSSTLAASSGGTGVANNAASTITISGNYGTTLTVSNTTSVTMPTSGTLATLSNAETLTDKAYPSVTSTSTGTGNINIDGVSYNDYNYSNGSSTATYTFVASSPPSSNTVRYITLNVGGGSGVVTKTWTNVTWMGATGSSTTVASEFDHYACKITSSAILCKIIAEGSTN